MAEIDPTAAAEACVEAVAGFDLDTAEGRRAANIAASRCAAEAACAYYSGGLIPPGICGGIGAAVGEFVGDVIESVGKFLFGDGGAEAQRKRLAAVKLTSDLSFRVSSYNAIMQQAVDTALVALIDAWDLAVPDEAGKLGGGELQTVSVTYPESLGGLGDLTWTRYESMGPAGYLLQRHGGPVMLAPLLPGELVPWTYSRESGEPEREIFTSVDLLDPAAAQLSESELRQFRLYVQTGLGSVFPQWLKLMQQSTAKTGHFVTTEAARAQVRIVAVEDYGVRIFRAGDLPEGQGDDSTDDESGAGVVVVAAVVLVAALALAKRKRK